MSGGNVNVSLNDGLYYVHYDAINLYKSKKNPDDVRQRKDIPSYQASQFVLDLDLSQAKYNLWLQTFRNAMQKRYKSYRLVDRYEHRGQRVVLENDMFKVAIEDNDWSFAVELISRPKYRYVDFQKHLFNHFFKGMREILLSTVDTIYIRSGSWTAEPFTKDDQIRMDMHIRASKIKLDPKVKATGGYNDDFERKVQTAVVG